VNPNDWIGPDFADAAARRRFQREAQLADGGHRLYAAKARSDQARQDVSYAAT
jgi:hypothetical protein